MHMDRLLTMKFSKELKIYMARYNKYVSNDEWFEYKNIKKELKQIVSCYPRIITNIKTYKYNFDHKECCVCLENTNLMNTFCCHNHVHHKCLVKSLAFSNMLCPLCRSSIDKVLSNNKYDEKECFDSNVLSLIAKIYQNKIKIENYYKNNIDNKIIKEYKNINNKAIVKICKKINKKIAIDIQEKLI